MSSKFTRIFAAPFFGLLLGLTASFGFAPHYNIAACSVGLSGLWLTLRIIGPRASPLHFFTAYTYGFGLFLSSLNWIGDALLVDGTPYRWAWPLAVAGIPAVLAVYYGLAGLILRYLSPPNASSTLGHFLCFVGLISGLEWLRSYLFTGFPWNLYGHIWTQHLAILQVLAPTNVYVFTSLSVFWLSAPGAILKLMRERKIQKSALLFALVIASFSGLSRWGADTLAANPTQYNKDVSLVLVQANIPQDMKLSGQHIDEDIIKHIDLSYPSAKSPRITKKTIIVWPESSMVTRFYDKPLIHAMMADMMQRYAGEVFLLSGHLRANYEKGEYYNSLSQFNRNLQIVQGYDKHHLVPFGEYIPFQRFIPLNTVSGFQGFKPGPGPYTLELDQELNYSPAICYEIIFSGQVINHKLQSSPPDFIVTVTNDAWFGLSAGPQQHFDQAIFRAIEERTPVIRAANSGISGVIDPMGRVLARSKIAQKEKIETFLPKIIASTDKNNYINNIIMLLALLCLGFNSPLIQVFQTLIAKK